MKRKLQHNCGSFTVVIPKEVADDMNLKPGDKLDFSIEDGKITARPVHPAAKLNVQAASNPVIECASHDLISSNI
jgi:AbrB family looped-hinge helix DNA binding protein